MLVPEYENNNFLFEYMAAKPVIAENPPEPSDGEEKDIYKKDFGEVFDNNLAGQKGPLQGMVPMWTNQARAKYEKCANPHIEKYQNFVDKLNRTAQTNYESQRDTYVASSLGVSSLKDLSGHFLKDTAISARYSPKPPNTAKGVRIVFWVLFIVNTTNYLKLRSKFSENERQEFIAETNYFFARINECRQANPYDVYRMKTKEEQYFDSVFFKGHHLVHPNRGTRPTHNKWIYLPDDDTPSIFKGVKLIPDKKPEKDFFQ